VTLNSEGKIDQDRQGSYRVLGELTPHLHSGFLQVRENWKKSGNLSGQESQRKFRGKYVFGKVRENEVRASRRRK